MWWFLLLLVVIVALLLIRLWSVLPKKGQRRVSKQQVFKCLVVLGSGGHTAEIFYDLRSLGSLRDRLQFTYLIADTDRGSEAQAVAFEQERGASPNVVRVPRAREVGQSYSSSIFSTLKAACFTLQHVLGLLPDIVLTNGPGTCVPVVFAAYVCRFLGVRQTAVIYSESFACVEHLSLSGKILYKVADRFTVQWPQLLKVCPRAEYAGRLCGDATTGSSSLAPLPTIAEVDSAPLAIVTVGSTKFDALIAVIDSLEFLAVLQKIGIQRLRIQKGNGKPPSVIQGASASSAGVDVEVLDYTPNLAAELRKAALVISHAGAGTILDCLLAARKLVVVPNEGLMNNHQVQLGMALQSQGVLKCLCTGELVEGLQKADFKTLRRFPEQSSPVFARCTCELLGIPRAPTDG